MSRSPTEVENCKRAALHRIARIQSYGALIAIDQDSGTVFCCSENIADITGEQLGDVLGRHWTTILAAGDIAPLEDYAPQEETTHRVTRREMGGRPVVVSSHGSERAVIVEIGPEPDTVAFNSDDRIAFIKQVAQATSPETAARVLLQHIARTTEFERVMLYKFLPGYNGEVIEEILKPGISGFLGLRFPEADIPANARHLYVRNLQRSIADTAQPPVDLIAVGDREPPDLSFSLLRAVHPSHITYMRNIGARASFSVSILSGDDLWGMVACHNTEPNILTWQRRLLCEELCRIVSMRVTDLESVAFETRSLSIQLNLSSILEGMESETELAQTLAQKLGRIRALFRADGAWLRVEREDYYDGVLGGGRLPEPMAGFVADLNRDAVYFTDQLPAELGESAENIQYIAGLLHIPFNDSAFITLCRKEQVETVHWAGKPEAIRQALEGTDAFTPRHSFATWAQQVRDRSESWSDAEIAMAKELREKLEASVERQQLDRRARLDGLTGVLNKATFYELLPLAISTCRTDNSRFALLMLDLDHFKPVNDQFGHPTGDALLTQVTHRLGEIVRGRDAIARLGGDEFAIIQTDIPDDVDASRIAARIAERIVDEVGKPFSVEGYEITVGVSVGISLYPVHGTEPNELLKKADTALYRAKHAGRNTYRLADAE